MKLESEFVSSGSSIFSCNISEKKFYILVDVVEDWHGALYRRLFDCLVDAVLHVPGAHVVLPPHHLCHLGSPVAKLRGGSEVRF